MHSNGNKLFNVKFNKVKLFIHPYFYLMIDHFFREGMPEYDMDSFDKPNEYSSDIEEYPVLQCLISLNDALICFASEQQNHIKINKTIAC